ncbi:hypothetical protein KZ773_04430 [Escherichia coli]|nr:hypothetical protein [Escherichia coli]
MALVNPVMQRSLKMPALLAEILRKFYLIFTKKTGGEPAADIAIVIGQEQHDIAWRLSTEAREDLKSIRIFDNTSATHYISSEDTIEYKPAGMEAAITVNARL